MVVLKMLELEIEKIENSMNHSPQKFRIIGGALEKILDKKIILLDRHLFGKTVSFPGKLENS